MRAVVKFGWEAQPGVGARSEKLAQYAVEAVDDEELAQAYQTLLEGYYAAFLREVAGEVQVGVVEAGQPVQLRPLDDDYRIEVHVVVGLRKRRSGL